MKLSYNLYLKVLLVHCCMMVITSCNKFKLLDNEDSPGTDAGANLKSLSIRDYLMQDHSTDLTALNLYASAVQRAGLMDTLAKTDEYTAVFLTNPAVTQMLATIGYATVADAPPMILKNLIGDLIIRGKIKSTDLTVNETRKLQTISGNYIYYTRTASTTDQYVLYINQNATLGSSAALVRTQNLEFKNGVAQVTSQFTYYSLLDEKSDEPNPSGNTVTQKLMVAKDAYIRGGNGNNNANFNDAATIDLKAVSAADATVGRIGVMQYPLAKPTFGDKIGSARMYVYVYNTGLTAATTFSFSAHLGENKDWVETAITWNNAPTYSAAPMATIPVPGATVGWVSFDVTSAVTQLYAASSTYMNVFLKHNVDNFIKLRPREFSSGLYSSYILLTSPPQTLLKLGKVSPLAVPASRGSAVLATDNLQMTGTEDRNIIYTVKQAPAAGFLVKYGIPLAANATFSQADIARGAVKYLYGGTGNADKIVFQARDHNGGFYESDLNLEITIN